MADVVNVHDAKTHFSRLLARVQAGEEIVIAKAGRPIARLVPNGCGQKPRSPGSARGQVTMPEDFHAPLPDHIVSGFSG